MRQQEPDNILEKAWATTPSPVRDIISSIMNTLGVRAYLDLVYASHLRQKGWFESYDSLPVDNNNNPIPWMPYACIDFLDDRLSKNMRVFEYGCGGSTEWFAERVDEVISVEHDNDWANRVDSKSSSNVTVIQRDRGDYVDAIRNQGQFEIIVVDGLRRPECATTAVEYLTDDGVLIWDDTYRTKYKAEVSSLTDGNFRELPFQGMGPVTTNLQRTSTIYRDDNCLDI